MRFSIRYHADYRYDGRVYDRDLPGLSRQLEVVLRAYRRLDLPAKAALPAPKESLLRRLFGQRGVAETAGH